MRVTAVQTPQQSGSGSATSMSLDTTAAVTATAETPTSEPIAGLAAAPTPQPSLVSVPGPLRTQNIPSMPFWRILPDQYRSEDSLNVNHVKDISSFSLTRTALVLTPNSVC